MNHIILVYHTFTPPPNDGDILLPGTHDRVITFSNVNDGENNQNEFYLHLTVPVTNLSVD